MHRMKYCIAVLLILLSASAHAALHKWVDAAGNVHYSDTAPPADVKEQTVRIPKAPADTAGEPPAEKSLMEREAELKKTLKAREEAAQQAALKKKNAAIRKQNCNNSRNSLRALENAPRIASYDAEGNQIIIDDATRQNKIEQARKAVSEFCD
jgi:hypothetical protein